MLIFLDKAREGISFNSVAYRSPTHAYRSDSCPRGMGGYSHKGFAWRWMIPDELMFRASNNLLEHLAAIITPWVDILAGRLTDSDCALSMTDSTTSEGWLRKSNFKEDSEDAIQATIRIEVARNHASRYMSKNVKEYSQWFPGNENNVADALSRDWDRSDSELTNTLYFFVPTQMPKNFNIVPLPNEITSWVTSLLQRLPVKEQYREKHTTTTIGRGTDGHSIATPLGSETISFSTTSQNHNEQESSELSPWLCVKGDFRDSVMLPWLKAQSRIPFHTWYRPSGRTDDKTQQRMKTMSLHSFYHDNSVLSEQKTPRRNNKRPFQV